MDPQFFGLLIGLVALLLSLIASVAGVAWRFGKIEGSITDLKTDVRTLQADVKSILQRLPPA